MQPVKGCLITYIPKVGNSASFFTKKERLSSGELQIISVIADYRSKNLNAKQLDEANLRAHHAFRNAQHVSLLQMELERRAS